MSRGFGVKNRAPASIQITAEQLLREAADRQIDGNSVAPKQQITDLEELTLFRQRKRKEFEDAIRMQREHIGNWTKYAAWEESQQEFERARSVYERALGVNYRNQSLWMRYAEMEMKHKFVNHARNVWDRAVTLHPRVNQFWLKYSYMEEIMGEVDKARAIFERWMEWDPDDNGWSAYIKFEMRHGKESAARGIFQRYVSCHATLRAFMKWTKWEEKNGQLALARSVFERALSELDDDQRSEKLFISFAEFEERCKEYERARVIYKYALSDMSKEQAPELYRKFISFEKKHGTVEGIEDVIVGKRRAQYEESITAKPLDYDVWFDYVRLEEAAGDGDRVRDVYERAVSHVPPIGEKRFWRRYIYLWIYYALYEELQAQDPERAREVLSACLRVIPHKHFTFAKIWLMRAHLEVRQKDLVAARKVLGQAIGMCPKESIFKGYISLEMQLGEMDRCRSIYAKYLEWMPENCGAWAKFAELEQTLGEEERVRAVYELAISQEGLDMPEVLWKAYIDFEVAEAQPGRARALYERLLERTQHVKVWTTFANFEASGGDGIVAARTIFQRGYDFLKEKGLKEERVILLDSWRQCEKAFGDKESLATVDAMLPRKFKKKRMVTGEGGVELGWEEFYDYAFPDEKSEGSANLMILEKAKQWALKRKAAEMSSEPS